MQTKDRKHRVSSSLVRVCVLVALALVLLPMVPLLIATFFAYASVLQMVIWVCWCSRGVNVLLVFSASPNWQTYIEANIRPRLPASAVVLNWSDSRNWKWCSLPVLAARLFGGTREFNPMVVIFRPLHWAKTYRFWKPLKDYKHGKTEPLHALETKLFSELDE